MVKTSRLTKKKILFLLEPTAYAGAEKVVASIINNLDSKRFDIYMAVGHKYHLLFKKNVKKKINFLPYEVNPGKKISQKRLKQLQQIDLNTFDIVSTHQNMPLLYAILLKKKFKIIHTQHIVENWRNWFWPDQMIAGKVDSYIAVSSEVKKFLVQKKGVERKKITLIYNGIELLKMRPNRQKVEQIRKKYKIHKDQIVIGYIGRLSQQKRLSLWLDVAKQAMNNKKYRWLIVGDGEENEILRQQVKKDHLPVEFTGWVDNPQDYLAVFDIFLNTSRYEGMSLTCLESLHAGNKFISTPVDGLTDIGKYCQIEIIDSNDPAAIWTEISQIKKIKNIENKNMIKKYFSAKIMTEKYNKIFNKLAKD